MGVGAAGVAHIRFGAGWRRSLDAEMEGVTEVQARGCFGRDFSEDDEIVNADSRHRGSRLSDAGEASHMAGISAFDRILQEVLRLPDDWHEAGSLRPEVLEALVTHSSARPLTHTAETGTGKSTLLLSHLSEDHTVFTVDDNSNTSLCRVMESALLNRERVHFVLGPTQRTLTRHTFPHPLQLVLLDGPHAYPFPEMEYWSFYPHLEENGLLIVDDIHIPTISRLFEFLREDQMFDGLGSVHTTAFFRRNATELFDPFGDGWWLQNFNRKRFSWSQELPTTTWAGEIIRRLVPASLRRQVPKPIRRVVRRIVGT